MKNPDSSQGESLCENRLSIVSFTCKLKSCRFNKRPNPSKIKNPPTNATKSQRFSFMPGDSQRRKRLRRVSFSPLRIAKLQKCFYAAGLQMTSKFVRDVNRAMASAGAADADRQVGFSLSQELRQKKIEKMVQFFLELLHFFGAAQVGDHRGVAARQRFQFRHVVRVRQKAHVENQICIKRHAVFVSERHHRYTERALLGDAANGVGELFLEGGQRQRRGIDDHVRGVAYRLELLALCRDAFADPPASRQRVLAPGLREAPNEYCIARVQENDAIRNMVAA